MHPLPATSLHGRITALEGQVAELQKAISDLTALAKKLDDDSDRIKRRLRVNGDGRRTRAAAGA